jgi:hypothetical protein
MAKKTIGKRISQRLESAWVWAWLAPAWLLSKAIASAKLGWKAGKVIELEGTDEHSK